jgi:hypothetical protein
MLGEHESQFFLPRAALTMRGAQQSSFSTRFGSKFHSFFAQLQSHKPIMKTRTLLFFLATAALWSGGCATRTTIWMSKPERTAVYLPNETTAVTMPVTVHLLQTDDPRNVDIDEGGRPFRVVLPDGTKLKGYLYVYKSRLDQAEKLVVTPFELTEERIEQLKQGQAVTVVGLSAKRKPIYKITLGMDLG